jgi:hypothetical protein
MKAGRFQFVRGQKIDRLRPRTQFSCDASEKISDTKKLLLPRLPVLLFAAAASFPVRVKFPNRP